LKLIEFFEKKSTINKVVSILFYFDGKVKLLIVEEPSKLICNYDKCSSIYSCLSFTSMGVNLDKNYAKNLKGMYIYSVFDMMIA
jgi:hypothetical protein